MRRESLVSTHCNQAVRNLIGEQGTIVYDSYQTNKWKALSIHFIQSHYLVVIAPCQHVQGISSCSICPCPRGYFKSSYEYEIPCSHDCFPSLEYEISIVTPYLYLLLCGLNTRLWVLLNLLNYIKNLWDGFAVLMASRFFFQDILE